MKRTKVKSSNIASVGYSLKRKELEVEFTNGDVYVYYGVVEGIHATLMASESKGKFFAAAIKGQYEFKKTEG